MTMKERLTSAFYSLLLLPMLPSVANAEEVPLRQREYELTPHAHFDEVLHEVFVDLTVIGVVFTIITLYFMFAYKRKSPDETGASPVLSSQAKIGWLIIPAALFVADDMFLFAKAWDLHENYRKVPEQSYEIKVTGSLWSWSYEYPNGVTTQNELVVAKGTPVLLRMTSNDVVHSHYMQRYRVTEDLMPGRVTYQWFMPDEVGESVVTCREYCGVLHSGMYGKIRVLEQAEFDTWLSEQTVALKQNEEIKLGMTSPALAAVGENG
ncbi:MAG: hypothetical protein OEW58_09025 [Gammaproteobacteria bacterium]|nr:hypothetical protein [Gammaproteobacteria bacterium]